MSILGEDPAGIQKALDKVDAQTLPELLAGLTTLVDRLETQALPKVTEALATIAGGLQAGVLADLNTAFDRADKLLARLDGAKIEATATVTLAKVP